MERAGSFIVDDAAAPGNARPGRASWYTPGLSDGLGDRLLLFDNSTACPLELLRFKREFSSSQAFEAALRQRVQELEHFNHPAFGRVRAVEWLGAGEGLALISDRIPGRRLSELLHEARGPTYARELVRQLTPALAALHQQQEGVAHGVLTADRIVITPEGKLVVVEHVLGSALESLPLSANRLRSELGLAVAAGGDTVALDCRADIVQLGLVALSLVVGRRVDPDDYPDGLEALLDEVIRRDGYGSMSALRLRWWLEHALRFDGRTFDSAREAQEALVELPEDSDMLPARYPKAPPPNVHALPEPAAVETKTEAEKQVLTLSDLPREQTGIRPEPIAGWSARTKQWIVVALAAAALVEAFVIGGLLYRGRTAAAPPAATPPLILIESDIPGAQVMVDGKKSPTPVMLNGTPGMRSIHLLAPEPTSAAAAVAATEAPPGSTGQVEITSDPVGARVTIDGARRGVTPLTLPLPPGQHAVVVSDGTTTASRTVNVVAGGTATVMAAMAPAGAVAGWLAITTPFELQVLESGNLIGTTSTARLMLSAGHHDLQVKNVTLGFEAKLPVEIQAGKTLTTPIAVPNGSLSVNALPWANVSLDGKDIGTTPVANLDVPLGTHELIFRHPQFGERRQTVVVTAKAPVRVVQDLRK
jgi:serine/threonine-protein kinase